MRGANEGHYPWDLQPQSMMTNATVSTVAAGSDSQTLKLDYKGGGTQTIKVKPGTPIVTFQPGTQADAKVGAKVFLGATKAADGTFSAGDLDTVLSPWLSGEGFADNSGTATIYSTRSVAARWKTKPEH